MRIARSFIPWVGGKSKLLWLIRKLAPPWYPRFIDVFGGSGTVTLSRPLKKGCMEVYNDYNSNLTNLFCCVKDRTLALLKELGFLPLNARDDFDVLLKFFSKGRVGAYPGISQAIGTGKHSKAAAGAFSPWRYQASSRLFQIDPLQLQRRRQSVCRKAM